jgi:hypothetical protein
MFWINENGKPNRRNHLVQIRSLARGRRHLGVVYLIGHGFRRVQFSCHAGLSGWAKANKMLFGIRLHANSTTIKADILTYARKAVMVGDSITHVTKKGRKEAESAAQPQNWDGLYTSIIVYP